jgi:Thaumatin family
MCSGGAACLANGKRSTSAQFCMPKNWKSGTFWPRTGCVLDESVSPATITCETGGCYDTSNTGQQLLDCSPSIQGGSPTNPATQFEVTSTPTSLNYDVSMAAGFNVESYVAPVGGGWIVPGTPATDIAACLTADCKADLNATCPIDLKMVSSDDPNKTIGCLDPCTLCQRSAGNLDCQMTFPGETYTDCNGATGSVTYQDMYCAKNMLDGNARRRRTMGQPRRSDLPTGFLARPS